MNEEANFRKEIHNVTEVMLVNSAAITPGPESSTHPITAAAVGADEDPLVILTMHGFLPTGFEDGMVEGADVQTTSIIPFTGAAQMYASLEEAVSRWPERDRIRFQARVDQLRISYRNAYRAFEGGQ